MADLLAVFARLRRLQTEAAKRTLGEAVAHEHLAAHRLEAALDARRHEADASRDPSGTLAAAYAAWLPAAARAITTAEAALGGSKDDSRIAQARLAACHAAQEAVGTLLADRDRQRLRHRARRAQSKLDEVGHRLS